MYYNLNHQSYLIFMELEFRPYLRTMDLNKDDWRIKINSNTMLEAGMYRGASAKAAELRKRSKVC